MMAPKGMLPRRGAGRFRVSIPQGVATGLGYAGLSALPHRTASFVAGTGGGDGDVFSPDAIRRQSGMYKIMPCAV
jgi:hypothetical protein